MRRSAPWTTAKTGHVADQRGGLGPNDGSTEEIAVQRHRWKQHGHGQFLKDHQTFDHQTQRHSRFSTRGSAIGQGHQLCDNAAAKADDQHRKEPTAGAGKTNKPQCQQKQEMVRSEQRMAHTTDQALPERELRTIRHGKGMVSQGWGRHQKKRQTSKQR